MLAVCMTLIDNDKDQTSFEDFYYRNRQIAYAFAYKILNNSALAEEACANAFFNIAKCFKKIHNYSLHDMDAYLIRTIRNACYAIYNKENQNPTSSIFDLKVEDEPSEDFYDDIDLDLLIDAVRKLDDKLKSVIAYKVYYDLTADEIREYRGTLTEPGKEDPYASRSVDENLALFEGMKNGECEDGSRVLRARIDMSSSNINMRDPIIYRVAHMTHHNTGDKWCIYPMYDFAHPIEDAIEGVTHSICTLEFEDHRPLYDWVVTELGYKKSADGTPKQIEFAKLYLTNVVTGKRYIKKLVEEKIVDGWDDPRLVSIAALRRRGYTPESIQKFVELCGISKANSSVDYAMLEYCIREDLKMKRPRMMAVLDPVKVVIDNYPEGQVEYLPVDNNLENPELGSREVPFTRELYIEREDFMEEPPKKYFRMFPGNEVRLMNAYFVKCVGFEKDANGKVTEIHCTYDSASKGGNSPDGRKVKGTIHWVSAEYGKKATVRLYENIVNEELGVYNEDGSLNLNPNSLTVLNDCIVEPALMEAKEYESFQFVRQGFFCADCKDSKPGAPVFNRIVSLKSSFKLPTNPA